jgi:zinc protease
MERLARERFGDMPAGEPALVTLPALEPTKGRRVLLVDKPDATQTYFRIGAIGFDRTNPDIPYVDVVNTVLGGRFTSWLNTELRVKRGLTYGVSSGFSRFRQPGDFKISSFTGNENTGQAIDLALEQLERLHTKGITQEELDSAKAYVLGQSPLRYETAGQVAATAAELEFYKLGADYLRNYYAKVADMTLEDVKRVVPKYFPREHLVFTLVGKAEVVAPMLNKYGDKVETKRVTDPGF